MSWQAGDRRRSELGWTIDPGVDPGDYSYQVLVVDEATGRPLAASEPVAFPVPRATP